MRPSLKRLGMLTAILSAVYAVMPTAGNAQIEIPPIISEPSPSPSPTSSSSPKPKPTSSSSSSPKPKPTSSSGSGETSTKKKTETAKKSVDPVIAEGLTLWQEREKSPARTTTRLLELIAQAQPVGEEPTFEDLRRGFGRFPVVGYVWYQDDYGAPRFKPYYSAHEGNDLFAVRGTPVIACADGYIWRMGSFSKGGNAVWLMGDDGVRYYYGHLHTIDPSLKTGKRVKVGDVIGTVGDSGNAKGTYPHVHFEVNPGGRGTINPKPILDRWLFDAEATVRSALVASRDRSELARFGAARWDLLVEMLAEPVGPPPALWAAAFDGTGSTLAYVDLALTHLLSLRDWSSFTAGIAPSGASGESTAGTLTDRLAGIEAAAEAHHHVALSPDDGHIH